VDADQQFQAHRDAPRRTVPTPGRSRTIRPRSRRVRSAAPNMPPMPTLPDP
jgi:hypothetical protein